MQSVFSGLAVPPGRPSQPITQLTSDWLLLCLPVLFCRRHVRSYSSMRNCQRSRFVQTRLIFCVGIDSSKKIVNVQGLCKRDLFSVWKSIHLSYRTKMDCRARPINVHGQFTPFS